MVFDAIQPINIAVLIDNTKYISYTNNMNTPTRQQIRSWMNRQRTLDRPSPVYLDWLRKQFKITLQAEVIKGKHENRPKT